MASEKRDPERALQRRERFAHVVANDALDASVGAAAGATVGAIAGPVGVVTGSALGALFGGMLGHYADREQREASAQEAALDDIDAEEEFFGHVRELGVDGAAMTATTLLREEHRMILLLVDAFESWTTMSVASETFDAEELGHFVEALWALVDRTHGRVEEETYFSALVSAGWPRTRGPIAAMLHEHEVLRTILDKLAEFSTHPERRWNAPERGWVTTAAKAYADLLRKHIAKEELVLFPRAESTLSFADKAKLDRAFEDVRQSAWRSAERERARALADPLIAKYRR